VGADGSVGYGVGVTSFDGTSTGGAGSCGGATAGGDAGGGVVAGTHPRIVQERLGHSSIATTLDTYSHTVPGLQKAAAERLDALLPRMQLEENVGKLSAEDREIKRRPYRSRTCDTLIKRYRSIVPSNASE